MKRVFKYLAGFAVVLCIQILFCGNVFAFTGTGDGTAANPYVITTAAQLAEMNNNLAACYILGNDIDLANAEWVPIGTYSTAPFKGTFDGAGHKIKNLKITRSTTDYVGLFSYVNSATIKNIVIENANVSGKTNVGALIGNISTGGTIDTCSVVTGLVNGAGNYTGGLIGYCSGVINILNCNSCVDVKSTGADVGGLVGYFYSTGSLQKSYALGNVQGAGSIGGLAGYTSGKITESYASGSVTSTSTYSGGLVGQIYNNATIENCFALVA